MSKQDKNLNAKRIAELILEKKEFDISFSDLIDKELNGDFSYEIINLVSSILADNGFEIVNTNPLCIEKK